MATVTNAIAATAHTIEMTVHRLARSEGVLGAPGTLPSAVSALVLSILLVVLMFGAVLWVVDGEQAKPTSGPPPSRSPEADPAVPSTVAEAVPLAAERRQRATSRRRPPPVPTPAPLERPLVAVATVTVDRPGPVVPARPAGRPLPRHRLRSSALLVVLVVFVGALVALVIGVVVTALAFALRSAVTS